MTEEKHALVVEGGAMRGVFSTGVLDGFLDSSFNPFDLFIGVSAGACNLAAYLADMPGRNFRIYSDYALSPEFICLRRFLSGGHLVDLDWMWDITIAELRLDLQKIHETGKPFIVVLTDAATGAPLYRTTDAATLEPVLKASSALPLFYRNFPEIDGNKTTDGGIADSIPIKKAIALGATKIMVIRSRPFSYVKHMPRILKPVSRLLPGSAAFRNAFLNRAEAYNRTLNTLRNPPDTVQVIEINPPERFPVSRLGRSRDRLKKGYAIGRETAATAIHRWNDTFSLN